MAADMPSAYFLSKAYEYSAKDERRAVLREGVAPFAQSMLATDCNGASQPKHLVTSVHPSKESLRA